MTKKKEKKREKAFYSFPRLTTHTERENVLYFVLNKINENKWETIFCRNFFFALDVKRGEYELPGVRS